MKFYPLTSQIRDVSEMEAEYKASREIGVIRIGKENLYFKKRMKIYYCPYSEIRHCFRRVMLVPAKLCCGKGELKVENLVICDESGEIAQIQLPGTKAAQILVEELKKRMPDVIFAKPDKES